VRRLRDLATDLARRADDAFAAALGPAPSDESTRAFGVPTRALAARRRRFEATYHDPRATALLRRLPRAKPLGSLVERVWWMPRFKRHFGDAGLPYLSADELFAIDAPVTKRILVGPDDHPRDHFVQPGWILMACSGQVYGLNGEATLATDAHAGAFLSHDVIRIAPDPDEVRAGYLLVALTHRTHGRPLLVRMAYGTSIPHLDPGDVAEFPVARLGEHVEREIAGLAERSAEARSAALALERRMAREATRLVGELLRDAPATGPTAA